jgi:hypothetical protein
VVKPFSVRELVARIRTNCRNRKSPAATPKTWPAMRPTKTGTTLNGEGLFRPTLSPPGRLSAWQPTVCRLGCCCSISIPNNQPPSTDGQLDGSGRQIGGQLGGPPGTQEGTQAGGQSRIQASLGNEVRILRVSETPGSSDGALSTERASNTISALALKGRSSSGRLAETSLLRHRLCKQAKLLAQLKFVVILVTLKVCLGDLRRRILVAVAGSARFAGLIGLWRARSIAKPLRELTSAEQDLADGDFTTNTVKAE